MKKGYQTDYASGRSQMYDKKSREVKAVRIIKTLSDYFGKNKLKSLTVLDVGASTGIIDNILAKSFKKVVGTDIDKDAIKFATKKFKKKNLTFKVEDAMKLTFKDNSFDIVICTHVYEHVPNSQKLFDEIYRVLKPSGVCYLAAINSLWPIEPHYDLPFLSYFPKTIANYYVQITGKAKKYYETPTTYWGMKALTRKFKQIDYTGKIVSNPKKFGYKIPSLAFIKPIAKYIMPTTFWILIK